MNSTDAFRICPHCNRRNQVRFKDYNNQSELIFIDHFVSEFDRRLCAGSGKAVSQKAELPPISETPTPALPPVSKPNAREKTVCPACGKHVVTKRSVRFKERHVFLEHVDGNGVRCVQSYQLTPEVES